MRGILAGTFATDGKKPKLETLQAGRGLAALAVLLFHINAIYSQEIRPGEHPYPLFDFGGAGVDYFFVLSGFIIGLIHAADVGRADRLGRYALKRAIRIYPIFWIIFTVFIVAKIAIGRPESSLESGLSYFWAYALLPFNPEPPLVAAWTLSHELLFYAVFGLAILNGAVGRAILHFWMAACVAAYIWTKAGFGTFSYPFSFLLSDYNLLFGFGLVAAGRYRSLEVSQAWFLVAGGLATLLVAALLTIVLKLGGLSLLYGFGSAILIAGLARLEELQRLSVHWSLSRLGDASYSIYLVHGPAAVVIAILLVKLNLTPALGATGTLLAMGTGALVAGILCYYLCERPLLAVLTRTLVQGPGRVGKKKAS